MRILITGGSGFVGRELVCLLRSQQHDVVNVDLVPSGIPEIDIIQDLTEGTIDVEVDFCFHLASATGGLLFNQRNNVILYNSKINENVLSSTKETPILFVSTLNVFEGSKSVDDTPFPQTPYAYSKWQGEIYFAQNAKNYYIVRPSNLFGKSQLSKFIAYGESHVIPDVLNKIDTLDILEVWGDGTQQRNFLHVKDLCNYLVKFLQGGSKRVNNVCSSLTLSIADIVKELLQLRNKDMPVLYDDSYMQYEKMFMADILDDLDNIGNVSSIAEGLAL